jgi:hypothetical protein
MLTAMALRVRASKFFRMPPSEVTGRAGDAMTSNVASPFSQNFSVSSRASRGAYPTSNPTNAVAPNFRLKRPK